MQSVSNRFEFGINLHFLLLCGSKVSISILLDPVLSLDRDGLDGVLVVVIHVREESEVLEHVLDLDAVLLQLQPRLPVHSDLLVVLLVTDRLLYHPLSFLLE